MTTRIDNFMRRATKKHSRRRLASPVLALLLLATIAIRSAPAHAQYSLSGVGNGFDEAARRITIVGVAIVGVVAFTSVVAVLVLTAPTAEESTQPAAPPKDLGSASATRAE